MKYKNLALGIIGTLVIGTVLFSCKKIETEDTPVKSIQDLNVPDGFEFNMVKTVSLDLGALNGGGQSYPGLRFQVFSGDPDHSGYLLISGTPNTSGHFITEVSIPVLLDSLYISSNYAGIGGLMVPINGNSLEYNYQNTPPFGLKSAGSATMFPDVMMDFSSGKQGFTAYNDNGANACLLSTDPLTPINGPVGPGDQFLWGFDTQGGARTFKAPSDFHGNIYGKYLAYDYYLGNTETTYPISTVAEIRITDGNNVLSIMLDDVFPHQLNGGWQTKYIRLDETAVPSTTGWRIGGMGTWTTTNGNSTVGSSLATPAQVLQILSNVTGILLAPERQNGEYSATGPEFIAIDNVGVVDDLNSITIHTQAGNSTDTDGDGVPDDSDDYPTDPDRAFNNYEPGAGIYGTIAFEDLWPGTGDYDFNDLVLDYRFNVVTNAYNNAVEIKSEFVIQAIGAGLENGFGFVLDVDPSQVNSVSGQSVLGSYLSLGSNGTEDLQSNAVIISADNVSALMGDQTSFVNTVPGEPYITPITLENTVLFENPIAPASLGQAPYNLFLITSQTRGIEIHLPGNPPTDLANTSLFGTDRDDSDPGTGKYYQTENNLPWAIHIPVSFEYPIEKTSIIAAYLKFAEWAESGGVIYTDWYEDHVGYRNEALIYSH